MANLDIQLLAGIPFLGAQIEGPFSWVAFGIALLPALVFLSFVIYFRWQLRKAGAATRALERLYEEALDRAIEDESKIEDASTVESILSCLADRRREVRNKAAAALRDRAGADVLREVAERMKADYHPERIAQAVADTAWSAMEPALWPLLDGKKKIARATLVALGGVGGDATLAILQERDHRPELREARTVAIARIKERLAPRRAGEVSLTEGDEGRVSLP